jgi:hypothetical protein
MKQQRHDNSGGGPALHHAAASNKPHSRSHHRKLGASLSLDKWAASRVSKYDKRRVLEKQQQLKAKQVNKFKKLRKRLEAEGKLSGGLPLVS